jgi:hypothetical protein
MKYWESATICSITPTGFSPKAITLVKWTVIGIFTTFLLAFWIYIMIYLYLFHRHRVSNYGPECAFGGVVVLSTIITMFAICKIFSTAKELTRCHNKVRINKKILTFHSVLLLFYCASVSLYVFGYMFFFYIYSCWSYFHYINCNGSNCSAFYLSTLPYYGFRQAIEKVYLTLDVTIPGAPKLIWTLRMIVQSELDAPESDQDESQILRHSSVDSEL